MRPRIHETAAWLHRGAFLALIAAVLLAPSSAFGRCGDHVLTGSSFARTAESAELIPLLDHAAMAGNAVLAFPAERPKPCTGALCSGNPATPLLPLTTVPAPMDHWAWINLPPVEPEVDGVAHAVGLCGLHPRDEESSVFHPPRAHSAA